MPSAYLRPFQSMAAIRKIASSQRRWMSVINLSDNDAVDKFRGVNQKSVLYFTASWCPPCRAIKPIYEELSKKYPDVAFGKVDVDENQESAIEFQVSSVPTFVFSEAGSAVNKFSGADQAKLEEFIQDLNN